MPARRWQQRRKRHRLEGDVQDFTMSRMERIQYGVDASHHQRGRKEDGCAVLLIICLLLSVAGQSYSEGGGEGGGRFHIEPVSRFWKGGRAFQQLSASRRGVWRSRYVDMRDSRGAIIYLVFSCSFSSYIFQASKNLCPYPSSPIHVFPFLLFPFLTGDRLSHKCE